MLKDLVNGYIEQNEYLAMNNATIIYRKLPKGINGFLYNKFGFNIIAINKNLSWLLQKETFLHELVHIDLGHSYLDINNQHLENEVEKYLSELND